MGCDETAVVGVGPEDVFPSWVEVFPGLLPFAEFLFGPGGFGVGCDQIVCGDNHTGTGGL